MFHAGHVAILKQAREFGDYVIAGVHSDEVVNAQRGFNMPIMNLNERVLSVLGCAYVNDVLIDAPLQVTRSDARIRNARRVDDCMRPKGDSCCVGNGNDFLQAMLPRYDTIASFGLTPTHPAGCTIPTSLFYSVVPVLLVLLSRMAGK